MSNRVAFTFPGQGSQSPGMGSELASSFEAAGKVFEEADNALAFPISEMCFRGTAEELALTENTQPATLTASVAALRALQSRSDATPLFVAGHSLGEYSALVCAGALSLADAVRIVRLRGRFMQEAVPAGEGAMAAILGSDLSVIEAACSEAAGDGVCAPANINSGGQVVIAGSAAAIDRAIELLKQRGAKRAIKLNVSAPFHCSLMMPAQLRLADVLAAAEFHDLTIPLVNNTDAAVITSGADARDSLVRQVSSPVRWHESVARLISEGVCTFVEIGPGRVLSGLIRQIDRGVRVLNVEDVGSLNATAEALAAG